MKKTMWTAFAVLLAGTIACGDEIRVPYEQETPEVTIDLATQVQNFEDGIVQRGGDDLVVMTALCQTEPGRNCNPPTLPNQIPRQIDDPRPSHSGETLDVGGWLDGVEGLQQLTDVSEAISFDPAGEVGVETPDQVKRVTVTDVVFKFSDNSLTYAMPPLNMYVGSNIGEDELDDPEALIQSKLTLFGVLDAIPPGDTNARSMDLDSAGRTAMSDALKALDVTLAVNTGVEFPPPQGDSFPKPDGTGTLKATIKAVFVISTDLNDLF